MEVRSNYNDRYLQQPDFRRFLPREEDLDLFPQQADQVDIPLTTPEYQNIDDRTAARMLGFFTQKMRESGFPWKIYAVDTPFMSSETVSREPISELEALRRLKHNKGVLLQPKRNLQLDLSSDNLGAVAAASALGGQATQLTHVANLATMTKNTRVSPGLIKMELKQGEPIKIGNYSELKLLHQLHCEEGVVSKEEEPGRSNDRIAATANQLSFFTQQKSDFGWRYYKEDAKNAVARMAEAGLRGATRLGLAGAGIGAGLGAAFALFKGDWSHVLWGAGIGGAAFGTFGGLQSARDARKGQPISAVEALQRTLGNEPIYIQKTSMQGIGVPILNRMSWYSDDGKANRIRGTKDLDLLYWMANQAKPLPKAPEPKKEEKAPEPAKEQGVELHIHHHYHR